MLSACERNANDRRLCLGDAKAWTVGSTKRDVVGFSCIGGLLRASDPTQLVVVGASSCTKSQAPKIAGYDRMFFMTQPTTRFHIMPCVQKGEINDIFFFWLAGKEGKREDQEVMVLLAPQSDEKKIVMQS